MMRVIERREWLEDGPDGERVRREVVFAEPRAGRRHTLQASREIFEAHPAGREVALSARDRMDGGDGR